MTRTSTERRRPIVASLLAFAIASASLPALADPSPAAVASAKALVADGRKLRDGGDQEAARDKFKAAWSLVPTPIIGLDLAKSYVATKQLLEAREVLTQIAAIPVNPKESPEGRAARDEAAALAIDLKQRIPSVILTIADKTSADVSLTLDGDALPTATLGQPIKVNPGAHVVVATSNGSEKKTPFTIDEGASKRVDVQLPSGGGAPLEKGAPAATEDESTPSSSATKSASTTNPLTYVGFGVAGAGVLVGSVTGLMAMSKASSLKSSPNCIDHACGPAEYDNIDSYNRLGTISTVSFVVAGAGAVVGVIGLLSPSREPAESHTGRVGPTVRPWVGLAAAGITGDF